MRPVPFAVAHWLKLILRLLLILVKDVRIFAIVFEDGLRGPVYKSVLFILQKIWITQGTLLLKTWLLFFLLFLQQVQLLEIEFGLFFVHFFFSSLFGFGGARLHWFLMHQWAPLNWLLPFYVSIVGLVALLLVAQVLFQFFVGLLSSLHLVLACVERDAIFLFVALQVLFELVDKLA